MIFITIDINVKYPPNMFKESITQRVRQKDGTIGQTLKRNKRDGNIVFLKTCQPTNDKRFERTFNSYWMNFL